MAYGRGTYVPVRKHPITGVLLNVIKIKRKALNFDEAVTAHVLNQQGVSYTDIVQMLGTNANRIGEVFNQKTHPRALIKALELMRKA
ncbi:hypothetical protein J7426_14405 [Tropicibacter sp. R16_0]|uniref:hypothetical protein n=1 Tax=Tropicibacter sp. R16_0 TaxID=2821102 RepID=UPI001ADB6B54|nr:hypothetical protein [Tropicibacter sp. R16_0]MBO9451462.1 hypothetical protein [Tropicibacter sp. R16_0]